MNLVQTTGHSHPIRAGQQPLSQVSQGPGQALLSKRLRRDPGISHVQSICPSPPRAAEQGQRSAAPCQKQSTSSQLQGPLTDHCGGSSAPVRGETGCPPIPGPVSGPTGLIVPFQLPALPGLHTMPSTHRPQRMLHGRKGGPAPSGSSMEHNTRIPLESLGERQSSPVQPPTWGSRRRTLQGGIFALSLAEKRVFV